MDRCRNCHYTIAQDSGFCAECRDAVPIARQLLRLERLELAARERREAEEREAQQRAMARRLAAHEEQVRLLAATVSSPAIAGAPRV